MSEEDLGPPLLSDSEPDSESESEGDSEDDDNIPVHHYLNNILNPLIVREPAVESEDQNPSGARGWTEPQGTNEAEHQEKTQEMLLYILETNDARSAVRETATLEPPPIRNPTPVRRLEQESSTTAEPLAENTTSGGEVDFDSEDDAALLECVQLDREAENLLDEMGEGAPPIFMSSTMLSYIINFP